MPATPQDIARFTSDGVLITLKNDAVLARDPDATDDGAQERELFFDDPDQAALVANELFLFVSAFNRVHEGIESTDGVGLGTTTPIYPRAPQGKVTDDDRRIDTYAAVRAYAFNMSSDTYAIEFIGLVQSPLIAPGITFDRTDITFDNDQVRWDRDIGSS